MIWRLEFTPETERDVAGAANWYETRQSGLGSQFINEVIRAWEILAENPLLNRRRHPTRDIRWCYPARFPYRIIYEVDEVNHAVKVAAVLHAGRHDRHWQKRL